MNLLLPLTWSGPFTQTSWRIFQHFDLKALLLHLFICSLTISSPCAHCYFLENIYVCEFVCICIVFRLFSMFVLSVMCVCWVSGFPRDICVISLVFWGRLPFTEYLQGPPTVNEDGPWCVTLLWLYTQVDVMLCFWSSALNDSYSLEAEKSVEKSSELCLLYFHKDGPKQRNHDRG